MPARLTWYSYTKKYSTLNMKGTRAPFPFTGENIYAPNEASLTPDLKFCNELLYNVHLFEFAMWAIAMNKS